MLDTDVRYFVKVRKARHGDQYRLSAYVVSPDIPNEAYPKMDGVSAIFEWWSDTAEPSAKVRAVLERIGPLVKDEAHITWERKYV